jgi:nesprin-1
MDSLFDKTLLHQRSLEAERAKWRTYEESSASLSKWLQDMEQQFKVDLVLKATLDEKKGQLQSYRTALQEIKSQKPAIDDLKDRTSLLPQKSDNVASFIDGLVSRHKELQDRVQEHVSKYEAFVTDHLQYTKAVMETSEWLTATSNTIEIWGDTGLERLSLHANLERLKNLQLSLPDEEHRKTQIKVLGEKVMPGTVDQGKTNIKIQIDTTEQDWQGITAAVTATIELIEQKIKQWCEYESMRDDCLNWLRDVDTKLHMFDLKSTLPEKSTQLEELRNIQGLVRAKELEIDALTDKTQSLYRGIQSMRGSHLTEVTVKYQNITLKVKDLLQKWQAYVSAHSDFEAKLKECQVWISQKSQKLSKALEMSMATQSEVDQKVELISDLLMNKDEGFKQIQSTIELAQLVLANTSPSGHQQIKDSIESIQKDWNSLASKMAECKVSIDDSIKRWAGFLDQLGQIEKTLASVEKSLGEATPQLANGNDIRNQIERMKSLEEKMKTSQLEINSIKLRIESMKQSTQGADAFARGSAIIDKHGKLLTRIQEKLLDYESQLKNYKTLKAAQDSLVQYLQRCRDKLNTMKQRSPNDKNYVDAITQGLDHLLNKEAQGQIIVEQLTQAGEVLLEKNTVLNKDRVRQDIATLNESFVQLFNDVKKQRQQMGQIMSIFRDFKEETERLTDWLQQANINIKAAKTSLLSTLQDKEKAVRDMEELNERLAAGKKDIEKYIEMANKMKNSCLEANVMMQQRDIYSKYQVTCSIGFDILKKIQSIYQHHCEYQDNVNRAKQWMEDAWTTIRKNTVSEGKSKEDLHRQLDNIRHLLSTQEAGQALVNAASDWGEKALRNTRSDGKDRILVTIKELQLEWEKLVKKMSSAKVSVETDLLQWSDAQQSVSRLQEWINDREKRLKQASEHKNVMITRCPFFLPGKFFGHIFCPRIFSKMSSKNIRQTLMYLML